MTIAQPRKRLPAPSNDAKSTIDTWLSRVVSRSTLVWAEHCTECVWPTCYADCPLYTPRDDLMCRRFVEGIQLVDTIDDVAARGRYRRLEFRRLGKLEASSRILLQSPRAAAVAERIADGVEAAHKRLPMSLRRRSQHAVGRLGGKAACRGLPPGPNDVFLILADYEGAAPLACTLTVRARDDASTGLFQTGIRLAPGKSAHVVPVADMRRLVDLDRDVLVQFEPAGEAPPGAMTFAFLDFAHLAPLPVVAAEPTFARTPPRLRPATQTAKCVVWDLDNTVWHGVLVEDGLENLRLEPRAVAAIVEFDRRGILQSVASKNTDEAAREALRHFGLDKYFLHPQINWGPKSESIGTIASALNIGIDTFVFVDDQPFERAEVAAAHPAVTVVAASAIDGLATRSMFDVPVTAESRRRRAMYQDEHTRQVAEAETSTSFHDFLRGCHLCLTVQLIDASTIERVKELAQRTNQLNYSGRRLCDADLAALLEPNAGFVGLVLSASDRFGDYGAIGFAVVGRSTFAVEDFFMSCRVQRKVVEHAFFAGLQAHAQSEGVDSIRISYLPTARNGPAWQALQDMHIVPVGGGRPDARVDLRLPVDRTIPHADIVSTTFPWPSHALLGMHDRVAAE